jgi:NAD(P)-dependent dehydrogenase (short-subunit alcohol dehydrogenase family)
MELSKFSLKGKVAIVVGGAGDIGHAIALTLANAGADVVVTSRKLENLQKVADEIRAKGRKALAVASHIAKVEDTKALVKQVMDAMGRIDILVNSSGASFIVPLLQLEERTWDHVMNVNVKGPFFLCQQVAPIMKEQGGGSIINITSYLGVRTEENLGAYCVSKAAVMHLTRVMAREWGKYNIRVNAIAPAWVHSHLADPFLQQPGINDRMLSQTVLGRFGEPDDVAAIALYLASDAAANTTAGVFPLDYGMLT